MCSRDGLAFYALRVADILSSYHQPPEIYIKGPIQPLEQRWDKHIRKYAWRRFSKASTNSSHYVFFGIPSEVQLMANQYHGTKNIVVVSLQDIHNIEPNLLAMADKVVCPSWHGANLLRKTFNVEHATYLPLDLPVPITHKVRLVTSKQVRVAIVCGGWPINHVMQDSLRLASELLSSYYNLHVQIVLHRSVPKSARSQLERLSSKYSNRVTVTKPNSLSSGILCYMGCDIALWMARTASLGCPLLMSLYSGTPAIVYDAVPFNELAVNGRNAVVVAASTQDKIKALPVVSNALTNYTAFKAATFNLLDQKNSLRRLRAETHYDLANRRILTESGWRRILGL